MTKLRPIYFNGKFYAGGLNGVHRVADRLIREVDLQLAAIDPAIRPPATLFLPQRRRWQPDLTAIRVIEQPGGHTQRWEQFSLPRLAADGVLVNLCNLAPIAHRRKILMLHDAQFLFSDSGYPWRQRVGYRMLVPMMARTSRAVLTISDYSRQMLDLMRIAPREKSRVVYNGADHIRDQVAAFDELGRLGLQQGGFVLMFGSAKAYKNIGVVCAALAASDAPRLVVIGPERPVLERAGFTFPQNALFVGPVDDAALAALYDGAHCLAFPSRTEGFGLPPIEAMIRGCPVVAAPAGAIPEIVRDAALYADIDDAAGWRDAIAALHDPDLRRTKIASGRVRSQAFDWASAGASLFATIEKVRV